MGQSCGKPRLIGHNKLCSYMGNLTESCRLCQVARLDDMTMLGDTVCPCQVHNPQKTLNNMQQQKTQPIYTPTCGNPLESSRIHATHTILTHMVNNSTKSHRPLLLYTRLHSEFN